MKLTFLTLAAIVLPGVLIPVIVYELTTGFCYVVCSD